MTYGFGINSDSSPNVAVFGMKSDKYDFFLVNTYVKKVKAIKSGKCNSQYQLKR